MDLVEDVRHALRNYADPQKAPGMQAYMKSDMPFLGVQKAARTKALRPVFAATGYDHDTLVEAATGLWDGAEYREERYAALALLRVPRYRRMITPVDEPLLRHLITTGAWWDLVDEVATKLVGPLREGLDIRAWAHDDNIWIRRAAIICQVGHKGRATDRDLLAEVIEANLGDRTFWIAKAIGWALRDYAYAEPLWVSGFVADHELAPLSAREATKHL
ncbi:MAG: DNA alkylation repair protein [Candidatus Nanopelagicales bacterium]